MPNDSRQENEGEKDERSHRRSSRERKILKLPSGEGFFNGKLGEEKDVDKKHTSAFASKILLATDGSPEAKRAARMAVTLSNSLGSDLHVLRVVNVPVAYYGYTETEISGRGFQISPVRTEEYLRKRLDEQLEEVRTMGGEVAGSHVGAGKADVEIVRLAEELDAGLVILGSRGFGPLRRALMGSVSESVVQHAHCPVLVVKGGDRLERAVERVTSERRRARTDEPGRVSRNPASAGTTRRSEGWR